MTDLGLPRASMKSNLFRIVDAPFDWSGLHIQHAEDLTAFSLLTHFVVLGLTVLILAVPFGLAGPFGFGLQSCVLTTDIFSMGLFTTLGACLKVFLAPLAVGFELTGSFCLTV